MCLANTMSHLYVIDDQDWSWLTYDQIALWHAEDDEWLKAREAAAKEAERRYYSVVASMERCMASARELARVQMQFEATQAELARLRGPPPRPDGPAGPAMD